MEYAVFTPEAKTWLDTNVTPVINKSTVKRLAFKVTVNGKDLVLTGNGVGKSQPTYDLLPYTGEDIVMIGTHFTDLREAPGDLEAFSAAMTGADIEWGDEEITVVNPSEEEEEASFEPLARPVEINLDEAPPEPTIIPMPATPAPAPAAAKKVSKGRKGKRSTKPVKSSREKILEKLTKDLGIVIPTEEVMFKDFRGMKGVEFISFKELAASNHPGNLRFNARGEVAKAVGEVLEYHEGNNIRNILNLSAEIDPNRVLILAAKLARYGRLMHHINATLITDEVPADASMSADGSVSEAFDESAFQVWDGRNRSLALALLYGPDVKIPVMVREMTFRQAAENCIESNMKRAIGKKEAVHYNATINALQVGDSHAKQFALCNGKPEKIAEFVMHRTVIKHTPDLFNLPKHISVDDRRTGTNITTPMFKSILTQAIAGAERSSLVDFNKKTLRTLNTILDAVDRLFARIEEEFPLHADRKKVWTSYSASAFGILLGERLAPYLRGLQGDGVEVASAQVMDMLMNLLSNMPGEAYSLLAQTPPTKLSALLVIQESGGTDDDDSGEDGFELSDNLFS